MLISALFLQSFIAIAPPPPPAKAPAEPVLSLLSADEEGFSLAGFVRPGDGEAFPIPFATLSERVGRAMPSRQGIRLALTGTGGSALDTIRVQAIPHAPGSQILASQEGLVWVGPSRLPRSVSVGQNRQLLPLLARQDGVGIMDSIVMIEPPKDLTGAERLFLLPNATHAGVEWFTFRVREHRGQDKWGPRRTYRVRPTARHAVVLETNGQRMQVHLSATTRDGSAVPTQLDQAFFAATRRVDEFTARDLRLRRAEYAAMEDAEVVSDGGVGPATRIPKLTRPDKKALTVTDVVSWSDDAVVELEENKVLRTWWDDPVDQPSPDETWTLLVSMEPKPLTDGLGARLDLTELDEGYAASGRILGTQERSSGWLVDIAPLEGVATGHLEGPRDQVDIRPTMGPGAAFGDVDGDGRVDLYLVQGAAPSGTRPLGNRLFVNRGASFQDFSQRSRTDDPGAGMGALLFDPDGDGDLDLYVANYGPDVFFLNGGTGIYSELTDAVGISGDRWSSAAVAGDADQDGDLDLYVTSYLLYDLESIPDDGVLGSYGREDPVEMLPFAFPGEANVFYRNDGFSYDDFKADEFTFTDITEETRLADRAGKGMQAAFWDFDQDGDEDLYIANDVTPNLLMRNEGLGKFRDVSFSTGMDDPRGGMGIAIGDVDGDLDEDLFLTNWELEANALYINNLHRHSSRRHRVGTFRDRAVAAGFRHFGVGFTSWSAQLFDLENDGDLDLFVANGYTSPDYESTGICVGQPNHLFLNDGLGRFEAGMQGAGRDLAVERASRCAIACDYDQDGQVEILVTSNNGLVQLLDNRFPDPGNWVGIRLLQPGPNRYGIGARVEVIADGIAHVRTLRAGTGYLGGNAPELHFGLGEAEEIDVVRVTWPGAETFEYEAPINVWQTIRR